MTDAAPITCRWCCGLAKANGGPLCGLCDQEHENGMHRMKDRLAAHFSVDKPKRGA